MSEVHRYKVVKMLSEVGNRINYAPHGPEVVIASDYDALLDERDQLKAKLAELEAIGALINSQDNRHTDQPMFAVMEKRGMVTLDTHDHDRIEWYDPVNVSTADDRTASRLEALHRGGRDVKDWERYAIKDVDVFVTACFTEQGCKDFLAIDGHNHREPFIYAFGSFRNSEYQSMRNWLKSLPKKTGDYKGTISHT